MAAGHKVHSVTHLGLEEYHLRLAVLLAGNLESVQDGLVVVTFCHDDIPSESEPLFVELLYAGHGLDGAVDLHTVPVGHCHEVVQFMMYREHCGFPDLAFLALAVAAEDEGAVGITVQLLAEGYAGCGGKALAEGAGGLEDALDMPYGRMALEVGTELAETAHFLGIEIACAGKDGIVHGGEMPCGEDEGILALGLAGPSGGILLHLIEIKGSKDIGTAKGSPRMAGLGGRYHPHYIAADLGGDVV